MHKSSIEEMLIKISMCVRHHILTSVILELEVVVVYLVSQ